MGKDKNIKEKDTTKNNNKTIVKNNKPKLTPYQQYLLNNPNYQKYKQSYFNFYDDVKDKTHQIYDW